MENMELWNKVKQPPPEALKRISGGRLNNMTDIKPQWRYEIMTEVFGPCGENWRYDIKELWNVPLEDGQILAFALVDVFYRTKTTGATYSSAVPGIGGSKLVQKESSGLFANDEGYKMAVTDAISTALQKIGVGADVYAGRWDGSKYIDAPKPEPQGPKKETELTASAYEAMCKTQAAQLGWTKEESPAKFKGYRLQIFPEITDKSKLTVEQWRVIYESLTKDVEVLTNFKAKKGTETTDNDETCSSCKQAIWMCGTLTPYKDKNLCEGCYNQALQSEE